MTIDRSAMRQRFPAPSTIEQLLHEQELTPPLGADDLPRFPGAKGELAVGGILQQLPPEWSVFHAIPVGGRNAAINHLVVGPGGIFTISAMHHGGDVWVGEPSMRVAGVEVPHLRDSEFDAERITHLVRARMPLLTPVQPVIALVNPTRLTIVDKPKQVKVIDAQDLLRWLLRLHPVLSAGEVQEVCDLVDSPDTWRPLHPGQPSISDGDPLDRLVALAGQVRSAGIRGLLWALAGVATVIGGSVAVLHAATRLAG